MVAVMRAKPDERAPSGPGNDLLEEWASWMRGGIPGGSHEWCVKERLDAPHESELPDSVIAVDRIVAKLKGELEMGKAYVRMLKHYYLGNEHPWQIAGLLGYTEGFVWLSLRSVVDLVARRYEDLT